MPPPRSGRLGYFFTIPPFLIWGYHLAGNFDDSFPAQRKFFIFLITPVSPKALLSRWPSKSAFPLDAFSCPPHSFFFHVLSFFRCNPPPPFRCGARDNGISCSNGALSCARFCPSTSSWVFFSLYLALFYFSQVSIFAPSSPKVSGQDPRLMSTAFADDSGLLTLLLFDDPLITSDPAPHA